MFVCPPVRRVVAACLILAVLAVAAPLAAAPPATEGVFDACGGLAVEPGPGEPWPGGKAVRPGTELSPADKGLGCRFVPPGKPGAGPAIFEARLTRPSLAGGAPAVDRWHVPTRPGEPAGVTYAFFPPGAAAPGEWLLELYDGDALVASRTFVMPDASASRPAVPAAAPVAAPVESGPLPAPELMVVAEAASPTVSDAPAGEAKPAVPASAAAVPVAPDAPVSPAVPPVAAAPASAVPVVTAAPSAAVVPSTVPATPAASPAPAAKAAVSPPKAPGGVPAKPAAPALPEPAAKGKAREGNKGFVALQTGLFADPRNAEGQAARLRARGIPACLAEEGKGKTLRYRVLAGRFGDRRAAAASVPEVRAAIGASPLVFEVAPGLAAGLRCR
ncbi:SPOR domain-containing protein [Solidesulfovibrio sp.]|uniref:SPOR domain-containing protein n=1 Tax=Solidesulfovibrio sp. TaxID=2910990 RepID=UPI00261015E0|nr:SPOR domain-containing protein [Solidesulfovibrio sp.]